MENPSQVDIRYVQNLLDQEDQILPELDYLPGKIFPYNLLQDLDLRHAALHIFVYEEKPLIRFRFV